MTDATAVVEAYREEGMPFVALPGDLAIASDSYFFFD